MSPSRAVTCSEISERISEVMVGEVVITHRRSSYACRRAGTCESEETYESRAPRTAASSIAIAAPWAR